MSFAMVIGGGLSEVGVSLFTLISLSTALDYGINAGIALVTAPLSSIFVAIVAYFRFG